jgi:hypothetical protein
MGDKYTQPDCAHLQNVAKFAARGLDRINDARPPVPVVTRDMSKKFMQFAIVFDLLHRGRPLSEYSKLFNLLDYLKFDMPKRHWSDNSAWEIARLLTHVLSCKIKSEVQESTYFSVSADEVTMIANENWVSLHIYIVQRSKRVPLLLTCK